VIKIEKIPYNRSIQHIWIKGWLKRKRFCYNHFHPHYNPIIDSIVRDLKKGLNRIIVVVGVPRSGKSWFSAWLMAYLNYNYYGIENYQPSKDNIILKEDFFWKVPKFLEATKSPKYWNRFITQEEQGVEQYKMEFYDKGIQSYDKLTQIFGIDQTNIIINLPYIFDLFKGTRLKAHYILNATRKSKNRIDVTMCKKWLSITTEQAKFYPDFEWNDIPSLQDYYPAFVKEYERMKREYNRQMKEKLTRDRDKAKSYNRPTIIGRI